MIFSGNVPMSTFDQNEGEKVTRSITVAGVEYKQA